MASLQRTGARDLALRVAGLVSLATGWLATRRLFGLVHLPPRHDASAVEFALAAVSVIGFTIGFGLAILGRHIHDDVTVSTRWARSPSSRDDHVSRAAFGSRRMDLAIDTPVDRLRRNLRDGVLQTG